MTVAAVAGQALGIAAYVSGVPLSIDAPGGGRFELSLVPYVYEDGGSAAGLGVAWVQ